MRINFLYELLKVEVLNNELEYDFLYNPLKGSLFVDYRKGFESLIRETVLKKNPVLYDKCKSIWPFTFSVYFPPLRKDNEKQFTGGGKVIMSFSTADMELLISVYNGLISLRSCLLFDHILTFERAILGQRRIIRENMATFKTMTPVIISSGGNNDKDDVEWISSSDETDIGEILKAEIEKVAFAFSGNFNACIRFKPIQIRRTIIRYDNTNMRGFMGMFELSGDPAILNVIYDVGLGIHRDQGFGMLELVK